MQEGDCTRRRRAGVVNELDMMNRDQLPAERETEDQRVGKSVDFAGRKVVDEFRNQDALPASARQVSRGLSPAETHARVPADQAVGRDQCRFRSVDGIDPEGADSERPRTGAVAARHV